MSLGKAQRCRLDIHLVRKIVRIGKSAEPNHGPQSMTTTRRRGGGVDCRFVRCENRDHVQFPTHSNHSAAIGSGVGCRSSRLSRNDRSRQRGRQRLEIRGARSARTAGPITGPGPAARSHFIHANRPSRPAESGRIATGRFDVVGVARRQQVDDASGVASER